MEYEILVFARWLGSNALLFFFVTTAAGIAISASLWWLCVHHIHQLASFAQSLWSHLKNHRSIARLGRTFSAPLAVACLSAYALLALLAVFVGVATFVEVADEVEMGEDIAILDEAFSASLRASTTLNTLAFFRFATQLGDPAFLTVLSMIIGLSLLWQRKWLLTAIWTIAVVGNGLLVRSLKSIFERIRPIHEHGLIVQEGWGFPSGHAAGSFAVYTMLAYLLLRGRDPRWWHLPMLVAMAALILLVGFSRVFLQVHYLSDVLAGYIVAGSWLCICIAGAEMVRFHHERARPCSPS